MKKKIKKIIYFFLVFLARPIGYGIDKLVNLKFPSFLVQWFIRFFFIQQLKVNLKEVEKPFSEYKTFLSFFTRRLNPQARVINRSKNLLVSPVDAEIIAKGKIIQHQALQIKGSSYFLANLFSWQQFSYLKDPSKYLDRGQFINLYLSPRDYHLIHHPFDAMLKQVVYLKGQLYPVNEFSLKNFSGVFARNKRVILFYSTLGIFFWVIWVGAFNVGKIAVEFDSDFYRNPKYPQSFQKKYTHKKVKKGEKAGAFHLGSSVLLLLPQLKKKKFQFVFPKKKIKMGQPLVKIITSK